MEKITTILKLAELSEHIKNIINGYENDEINLQLAYDKLSEEINLNNVINMNVIDSKYGLDMWNFVYKYDFTRTYLSFWNFIFKRILTIVY